ncbi:MAG: hypothetical protein Q8S21_02210 [Candidatus Paracaedibacteraceae bacterium]|nr:hypothetical protein [Candidatus Paracaedibacteraceae bacterium]
MKNADSPGQVGKGYFFELIGFLTTQIAFKKLKSIDFFKKRIMLVTPTPKRLSVSTMLNFPSDLIVRTLRRKSK